jgi:hypothetical protein
MVKGRKDYPRRKRRNPDRDEKGNDLAREVLQSSGLEAEGLLVEVLNRSDRGDSTENEKDVSRARDRGGRAQIELL